MSSMMDQTYKELLTSLEDDEKLPVVDNIKKSVGRIENTKRGSMSIGTVFISEIMHKGRKNPVIFSAGHNFAENRFLPDKGNFADTRLTFGFHPAYTLDDMAKMFPTAMLIWNKSCYW